jgi:hypothetical protein
VDPIGFIVVCVALYGILQRTPALLRDMAAEIPQVLRGDGEPFADARRQKLADEGVEPTATGSRVRDHLGDMWKDLIHDLGAERRERRTARGQDPGTGWFGRMRGRVAEGVDSTVDDWGGKVIDGEVVEPETPPANSERTPGGRADVTDPAGHGDDQGPVRVPSTLGDLTPESTTKRPELNSQPPRPAVDDAPPAHGGDTVKVPSILGEPQVEPPAEAARPLPPATPISTPSATRHQLPDGGATAPGSGTTALLELEGIPDMSNAVATTGGQVTGVISGANEANAIYRQLEAATQEYVAQIAAVRRRINNLGSDTLSLVQFSGTGAVVTRMGQAAEAAAAAEANARQCSAEVGPLLLATKREFDKRNS